jgi:hypothetical protein
VADLPRVNLADPCEMMRAAATDRADADVPAFGRIRLLGYPLNAVPKIEAVHLAGDGGEISRPSPDHYLFDKIICQISIDADG